MLYPTMTARFYAASAKYKFVTFTTYVLWVCYNDNRK